MGQSIKGRVYDNKGPVEFANVLLYRTADTSKVWQFASTDSLGQFELYKIPAGAYQLHVVLVGHSTWMQQIAVSANNPDIDLGQLILKMDTEQLRAAEVTAQRRVIQKTPQGYVINAESNITQMGGTATDLFRNAPTVSVDAEGGITLRGKTPLILINGRYSSITSLDQIAASSIESIEVITNPSAKYDAFAESGIINIKLKKNKEEGINGAFAAGMGAGSKGRVNSMALINDMRGKWNLGLAYDNRFAGRTRSIEGDRTNADIADEHLIVQSRADNRVERLQNLKLNADFNPDEQNVFAFEAMGNLTGQDNNESLNTFTYNTTGLFNSANNRYSEELRRSKVAEFALTYNRKYKDPRTSLSAALTTSINSDRENTDIATQLLNDERMNIGDPSHQKTHNYENGNISNAMVDYAFPVGKNAIVETGYKGILRILKNDFMTSDKEGGNYVVDPASTNIFDFTEQVHAAYAQYNATVSQNDFVRWRYSLGLRTELVANQGNTENDAIDFRNNYLKLFPNANAVYYTHTNEYWKLGYGKRINYPGAGQLNPFVDITDVLNQHSGNPYLKPEVIHSLELGHNKDWSRYSLSSTLFYRHALNTIKQYSEMDSAGVILSLPRNFGKAVTYGIENVLNVKPWSFYNANLSISLYEQGIEGSSLAGDVASNAFCWYGKLINNFVFWNDSKLQVIGSYNSPVNTPQGKTIAAYGVDMGLQKRLGKSNAYIGMVATDIFNTLKSGNNQSTPTFLSHRTSKADTRALIVTFAYTFNSSFKEKLLENKFSKEY